MIISDNNINTALYNQFKSYIDKYISYSQEEESVNNISNKQIPVLQLYCVFELFKHIYDLSIITDEFDENIHTLNELFIKYDILRLDAELQKIDININDIISMFFNTTITTDLLIYKNANHSISKLKATIIPTIDILEDQDIDDDTQEIIYKGTTNEVSILVGYTDQPRPNIGLEWKSFSLYVRLGNTNYVEFYWNKLGTPKANTYPALITNTAGQILFTFTPSILNLLSVNVYDLRLFFTNNDDTTDVFINTNAINIKL